VSSEGATAVGQGDPVPDSGGEVLLQVEHLVAGYGDLRAVWDLSLEVLPGRITVLLGSNGAGKTTTLLAVAGVATQVGGSIRLLGEDIGGLSASARTARGLALVQEGKRIFRDRTVEQNLRIGGWSIPRPRRRRLETGLELAYQRFPVLAERRRAKAGSLSGGQQQMLAIAQALMPDPKVVMLDEPSVGLAPIILEEVLAVVEQLRSEGYGILLVEQLVDTALSVADDVVVIDRGRISFSGPVSAVGDGEVIRNAYLGSAVQPAADGSRTDAAGRTGPPTT
jgi:branched-chain amino acid transport system ATP-binding protein